MPITRKNRGSITEYMFGATECRCQTPLRKKAIKIDDRKLATLTQRWTSNSDGSKRRLSPDLPFEPGSVIGEIYKVEALIGEGGMGAVYRARHQTLGRTCAVKVLYRRMIDADNWKRFQLEAKALSSLSHPCFVQVYDLALHQDKQPFYAMENLTGETLETILHHYGSLTPDEALELFIEIADGIAFAHRNGIIHRDIKPANIFLERLPNGSTAVKILDFGIAKLVGMDRNEQSLTGLGEVFGTPYYMSPEQCLGEHVDQRSDIYSLGCTLFEALAGRPPFDAAISVAIVEAHISTPPPGLSQETNSELPEGLEELVAKCLEKDPEQRYQNMRQLISHMRLVLKGEGSQVTSVSSGQLERNGIRQAAGQNTTEGSEESGAGKGRARVVAAISIVVIVLAIGAVTYLCISSGQKVVRQPDSLEKSEIAQRTLAAPPQFFSHEIEGGGTAFVFPPAKEGIGEWSIDGTGYKQVDGPITGPPQKRLFFKAGELFFRRPEFFGGFRPDDLKGLAFRRDLLWNSQHFAQIARLQSLQDISLSSLLLKASDLKYVEPLPRLIHLAVSDTGLEGKDLAKLSCLDWLMTLEANEVNNITPVIDKLQSNRVLDHLSVKQCGLTDSDMKKIGRIRSLRSLCIDGNLVTVVGVRSIAGLYLLDTLRMGNQNLGPEIIEVLPNLKHLAHLRVQTADWSQADRDRLRRALPQSCQIEDK